LRVGGRGHGGEGSGHTMRIMDVPSKEWTAVRSRHTHRVHTKSVNVVNTAHVRKVHQTSSLPHTLLVADALKETCIQPLMLAN
jgi:hypothetical protein